MRQLPKEEDTKLHVAVIRHRPAVQDDLTWNYLSRIVESVFADKVEKLLHRSQKIFHKTKCLPNVLLNLC
jgi:hypothetical protein